MFGILHIYILGKNKTLRPALEMQSADLYETFRDKGFGQSESNNLRN